MNATPPLALPTAARLPRLRLIAFACGDFAFNLYWQSVMLYLLFYYTEGLGLPLPLASAGYALAMGWDGLASLAVGIWADRRLTPAGTRAIIGWGALPLATSFALAYVPPASLGIHPGAACLAWVLAGHLLFRTAYALVNIPYLALSARIATDDADRALLAGGRMLAGAGAAVLVAVGTLPLGTAIAGGQGAGTPAAYFAAALVFALLGAVVLGLASRAVPLARASLPQAPNARAALTAAWHSRAFVNLAGALLTMTMASTMIDKTVLYYFKYHLQDQQAGELTLGWMMGIGALAVPGWMALARVIGVPAGWLAASGICAAALALFIAGGVDGPQSLRLFLVVVQAALVGLQFALWAFLPAVIARSEAQLGQGIGAAIYGYSALIQRAGIGLGTRLVGGVLRLLAPGHAAISGGALRAAIASLPLSLLALSVAIILGNPLMRRGSRAD